MSGLWLVKREKDQQKGQGASRPFTKSGLLGHNKAKKGFVVERPRNHRIGVVFAEVAQHQPSIQQVVYPEAAQLEASHYPLVSLTGNQPCRCRQVGEFDAGAAAISIPLGVVSALQGG